MIAVLGLWHLGCVTAACCAEHFKTVGVTNNEKEITSLLSGKAPVFEPGLNELIKDQIQNGQLTFSTPSKEAFSKTRLLWVTYDTPVDQDDVADVDYVLDQIRRTAPLLNPGTVVLISSQLPVGSIKLLEKEFSEQGLDFACSPENLRLGKALEIFKNPDRIVIGIRDEKSRPLLQSVLEKFSNQLIWMSIESAEMTKHAINSFLALSVAFANELAGLCEATGANAHEVVRGLKSESRIGPRAYLAPGGAFAGGTLARDVQFLTKLGKSFNQPFHLIPAILKSNDVHKDWVFSKLNQVYKNLSKKKITILGLTYKPNTNTLRRSSALELCQKLIALDALVFAFDPAVPEHQPELGKIELKKSAEEALSQSDAALIMTEWPEFKNLDWEYLVSTMSNKLIIDQNQFCGEVLGTISQLTYLSVGIPS
ncbi:MAG: UDP-glucose/GDP-mannose dehydrogenase family protein [SAR324 cluster bacterium]|nr:UDP-glucose/GDP-mannose dehydrogenase family protein [SAR324 cluster bacterium]